MAGPVQSAVLSAIGSVGASVGVAKGIKVAEEKEAERLAKEQREAESNQRRAEIDAKKAERETLQAELLSEQLKRSKTVGEREESRLREQRSRESRETLRLARARQMAKDSYIKAITEKQLGTKLGTRTSMAEYFVAASGGQLGLEEARQLTAGMSNRQIRKIKVEGGAHGNK